MRRKPTFGLRDIPDDWEIRLHESFVDSLDKLNRPWAHDGSGKKRGDAVYWYLSTLRRTTKVKMTPEELEYYYASYRFSERLWGWKRRPRDKGGLKFGIFIKKDMIPILREGIDITDSEVEKVITGMKISSGSDRVLSFPRLPITANKYWAWIMGLFYASGSGRFRDPATSKRMKRVGLELAMKVHNPVIEYAKDIGEEVGVKFKLYERKSDLLVKPGKTKGMRTGRLRRIGLGWPEYLVLKKFGMSYYMDNPGLTARYWKPVIPDWVKEDDDCMLMFIEGLLNGGYGVSSISLVGSKKRNLALAIYMRISGLPEEYVKEFATTLHEWLVAQGTGAKIRKFKGGYAALRGKAVYEVGMMRWDALWFIVGNMNIIRPDLRSRLLARIRASEDPVFNEAMLHLRSPHNVILGMILEEPRTTDDVDWALQVKREGVVDALRSLQMRGMIVRVGNVYHLDLSEFEEREIRRREGMIETLSKRAYRYSNRLLYRCTHCQRVYVKERTVCGKCDQEVQPVERQRILQSLHARRTHTLRRLRKLRGKNNG